jgi:phage tail-like protein
MSDQTGKVEDAIWPMPKFNFRVELNGATLNFSEVSGLDAEAQNIQYRHGNHSGFYTIKMPGIQKVSNVTLKRGVFVGDSKNNDWFSQFRFDPTPIKRNTVTIELLNEDGKPSMAWRLLNAWPTKITSTDMKSDGNEVAIDTLDIAFEGLEILHTNNL